MDSSTQPLSARERVLHTAHRLFYQDGIRATGIDRIIEQAAVTKVTFYRHFPSKNHLVEAYLEYRHQRWIDWFNQALSRYSAAAQYPLQPIWLALRDWFLQDDYRGCAFINTVVELAEAGDFVAAQAKRHKADMMAVIHQALPQVPAGGARADAIALAIDGAIVRVQFDKDASAALAALEVLLKVLL